MSWQDYVEKQLLASKCVTKAAIVGHDGNVWAKSEGFDLAKDELSKLIQGFDRQDILTSTGVTLGGTRYIYLSGTDRVIRAKLGKVGVHCMKTTQGNSHEAGRDGETSRRDRRGGISDRNNLKTRSSSKTGNASR